MTNWLSKGMQFDAVVSNNDEMAIGALQAMKSAGVDTKKAVVGGIDATQDALASMKAGDPQNHPCSRTPRVRAKARSTQRWRLRRASRSRRGLHPLPAGDPRQYGSVHEEELSFLMPLRLAGPFRRDKGARRRPTSQRLRAVVTPKSCRVGVALKQRRR